MPIRKRECVAIDFDRRELRLVVFEYVRKAPVIRGMHAAAIPADVNADDAASLGGFLRTLVTKLHLSGAKAMMCVGRAQAVLKSLSLPPNTAPGELPSMVQFQVAKELPFAADEAVVDFTQGSHWDSEQAGGVVEAGVTVLAAAVRLPVVDAARQLCTEAGLHLQRLGLRPYANLRAVSKCVRLAPEERVVLVNVTAGEVEIDVIRADTLEFSRAATLAAPATDEPSAAESSQARSTTVRRVADEVARSLQSFHAVQRGAEITGCLVSGGTGLETDVVAALAERLGVRCEMFDPSGGFALRPAPALSAFSAALGLAAGQAAGALPFDFLNPKRPAEKPDRRRSVVMAAVAGVMAVVLGIWLGASSLGSERQIVTSRLSVDNEKLLKQKAELKKLMDRAKKAESWMAEDGDWLDQLAHVANTLPPREELYLLTLKCVGAKISLSGRVKDAKTVSRLAEKLMAMPGYEVRQGAVSPTRADRYGYNLEFTMDVLIGSKAEPVVTQPAETIVTQPAGPVVTQPPAPATQPAAPVAPRRDERSKDGRGGPRR